MERRAKTHFRRENPIAVIRLAEKRCVRLYCRGIQNQRIRSQKIKDAKFRNDERRRTAGG